MTLLGITDTKESIFLPPDTLHTYILGNTGTGKTTLERSLIAGNIEAGHGVCVIDPHGERSGCLVDCVVSDLPQKRIEDVILFDVNTPAYVPGLKPFYCRNKDDQIAVQDTISTALNMFEKVYNVDRNTMARIIAYIESLIYLFIYDESLTLLDIPHLLNPDSKYDKKRLLAVSHLPPSPGFHFTRDFWTEEYTRRAKRGYNQDSEIFGTLMKFRELSSHLLWPMFCQSKNTLDIRHIMQQKKILLVKLNGNWEDITSLLGSYLIGQIKDAAFHRSLKDPPFYLYVDEFQRMASRDFLTLFSEARGGNVHVTIDHQVVSQLDEEMKETIRQASTFVCFGVTDITAEQISGMFDTTPPPGEWIYEKMMRKAKKEYVVNVWDSPRDEARYIELGNLIQEQKTQSLIISNPYEKLPVPHAFPVVMTPKLWEAAENLMRWFRPYEYDPQVIAYAKNLYEKRTAPYHWVDIRTYKKENWWDEKTRPSFKMESYYLDYYGKKHTTHFWQEKIHHPPHAYYAIKSHIEKGKPYRFPHQLPLYYERQDGVVDAVLMQEFQHMYLRYRRYACYYFDVDLYHEILLKNHHYDASWGDEPYAGNLLSPFKGPYFRTDGDWLAILKWIYEKSTHIKIQQTEVERLEVQRQELYERSFHEEIRSDDLGYWEPEPVEEWEYLAHARAFARARGEEFMVGDNSKYRARLGNPPYGSDEVERRTANQIKKLDKYTARVRISSGEYTITTIAPIESLTDTQLAQRIEHIYAHNLKAGYLRLRSDVEKEVTLTSFPQLQGNNHTPVQPVPLPTPQRK